MDLAERRHVVAAGGGDGADLAGMTATAMIPA
jgi:hypothetical protein